MTTPRAAILALLLSAGCAAQGMNPADRCDEARAHVGACLGAEVPYGAACSDAEAERAGALLATSCGALERDAEASQRSADGDGVWCQPWMRWAGRCCQQQGGLCAAPTLACQSGPGGDVFSQAWQSDHGNGTVPSEHLVSGRNSFEGPLANSIEIFPRMADLIAEARHEVDFVTFDYAPWDFRGRELASSDDPGRVIVGGLVRLEERLAAERARGERVVPVVVRFVIDGAHRNAPEATGGKAIREVRALIAQVEAVALDPTLVDVRFAAHERFAWGAVHSKLLVVDGVHVVLAGTNPQPFERLGRSWRDVGVVVHGEIGAAFQGDFDDTWLRAVEVTSCDTSDLDADELDCELAGTRAIVHAPEVESPDLSFLGESCTPMFAATRRPHGIGRTGWTFDEVDNPQDAAWIAAFSNARETIRIESPNLNDDRALDEIAAAAERGVDVRVLLSLGFNASAMRQEVLGMSAGGANVDTVVSLYERLGERGLCDRVQIRWVSVDGVHPTWVQEQGATHSKLTTFDGRLVIVGSGNQDNISWNLAQESNVLIDSAEAARAFDAGWFDPGFEHGIDVFDWAREVRDGEASFTSAGATGYFASGMDLHWLFDELYGSPEAWAERVLAACGE